MAPRKGLIEGRPRCTGPQESCPKLLLLDETFAPLDPASKRLVQVPLSCRGSPPPNVICARFRQHGVRLPAASDQTNASYRCRHQAQIQSSCASSVVLVIYHRDNSDSPGGSEAQESAGEAAGDAAGAGSRRQEGGAQDGEEGGAARGEGEGSGGARSPSEVEVVPCVPAQVMPLPLTASDVSPSCPPLWQLFMSKRRRPDVAASCPPPNP